MYCDFTTSGGPWTVIQRRTPAGSGTSFYRTWAEYATGFWGTDNNHWLGNDKIRRLSVLGTAQLRINFCQGTNCNYYAHYGSFGLGDAASKYTLQASGYSGNTGDSLSYHSGRRFSTKDADYDACSAACASSTYYYGAWWYGCCHYSNLNGLYGDTRYAKGPVWYHGWGYYDPLEYTQMAMKSSRTPSPPTTTCERCTAGTYQSSNTFQGTRCTDCEGGKYQASTSSASCNLCGAGQVQPGKQPFFQEVHTKNTCVLCVYSLVHFSFFSFLFLSKITASGQTACANCDAGKYQGANGRPTCAACAVGRYQSLPGQTNCKACESGKYQTSTLSVACDNCQKGQYNKQTAQTGCTNCEQGKTGSTTGLSACGDCTLGKFQDGVASTECKDCGAGKYADSNAQQSCQLCGAGRFQSETGGECYSCVTLCYMLRDKR